MKTGIDIVKEFEGCRLTAYLCPADKWTIGYGATFYENGVPVRQGDTITQERAEELLSKLYIDFESKVKPLVLVEINENQLGALTSFAYNVGIANLKSSTLLRKLNSGDYEGAQLEFGKWIYSNKVVLNGLVRRREAESKLFATPIEVEPEIWQKTPRDISVELKEYFSKLFGNLK